MENLEQVHADALRSGYMDEVIAFAKGRSLERIRGFALAAEAYRKAALRQGSLEMEALRSASLCDTLEEAADLGFDPDRPPETEGDEALPTGDSELLAGYERRVALLEALEEEAAETPLRLHDPRGDRACDAARARWFASVRLLTADGNVRALAERQRLVVRTARAECQPAHAGIGRPLRRHGRRVRPGEPARGLRFDPPTFQELVDGAARLYEAVANQDGSTEKLQAQQRLEAFLAFTLQVDRDRFTQ